LDSLEDSRWKEVQIGEDPWIGAGESYKLSEKLIDWLHTRGIFCLRDASKRGQKYSLEPGLEISHKNCSWWDLGLKNG